MEITEFAPILIPTLNRYEHFKCCVESFARCTYADQSELVVGLDYPPAEKYREGYEKIKDYVNTITGFKKVIILSTDHNLGVTENCNRMYHYIREQGYESYVFSEDDNEVAPCFLEYANWGLQYTKDDERIYAVCGFKRVDTSFLKNNVYIYPRFNAWGFAQWFKRRDKVEEFRNLTILKGLLDEMSVFSMFTSQVYKGAAIINMLKEGAVYGDGLSIFLPKEEQYCMFPTETMSKNHGQDGSGIHGGTARTVNLYEGLRLSEEYRFIPHIEGDLYQPELEAIYKATYKVPLLNRLRSRFEFFLYKSTGLGVFHKYGHSKFDVSLRKIKLKQQ